MDKIVDTTHQNQAVDALKQMIGVASFYDETTIKNKVPFGKGIDKSLDTILKIASDNGFRVYKDPAGNYGYAEVGFGDKIFGIIGHVDEVPAGNASDWTTDPYTADIRDGRIYGRGAQDDKGPTLAAMFAVKALMDQGYKFTGRVRFIFGTDEENLWRGINMYNQKEETIDLGIAPDAEFPLIYAEKGLQEAYLVGPGSNELTVDLKNPFNAVPANAEYTGPKLDEVKAALDAHKFEYTTTDNGINVIGKAAHAMNAPQGVNAILRLAIALDDVFGGYSTLDFFGEVFKEDATGTNLLGKIEDAESGQLTFNISSLEINEKESRIQIDMRIPVTVDRDSLLVQLKGKVAPFKLKYEEYDYLAPLYVPTDSTLVKTLMATYKDLTGDDTQPQISGGATYARTMNNTVAFGALLPGAEDTMHQVDENWELDKMFKAMDIYAEAIKRLWTE